MLSKRLKSITYFIDKKDKIVDVGCDHGLLSIYLYENKLCKSVMASDINPNALANAKKNISQKKLKIETILSDGINQIDLTKVDTIIISGMGTNTILHILEDNNKLLKINKLIIQSNNDHELLRREINKKGFYLKDENIVNDNKKYYITMCFSKDNKKNTEEEYKYGIIKKENVDYYNYLIAYNYKLLKKIPITKIVVRHNIKKEIKNIKNIIK